jgi:hypothetical protein
VLALFVKTLEAKLDFAVFGALPRISAKAREVAQMHGIKIAEGLTPSEVANKILEIFAVELPPTPVQQQDKPQAADGEKPSTKRS